MYLYVYYNSDKQVDDGKALNRKLNGLKQELLTHKCIAEHEKDYQKYFIITETPNGVVPFPSGRML